MATPAAAVTKNCSLPAHYLAYKGGNRQGVGKRRSEEVESCGEGKSLAKTAPSLMDTQPQMLLGEFQLARNTQLIRTAIPCQFKSSLKISDRSLWVYKADYFLIFVLILVMAHKQLKNNTRCATALSMICFLVLPDHIFLASALLDHSQPEAASLTGLTSDPALMLRLALFDVQPSAKSLTLCARKE